MRKIHVLKAIIDFIWIVTIPIGTPLILIAIPAIFFYDLSEMQLKIQGLELLANDTFSKILFALFLINFLLIFYSLHLFRKSLRYFLNAKIFDDFIIKSYKNIGSLLLISGVVFLILSVIGPMYFGSKITVELGINSNLLLIALGLFFLILSEVFTIAKRAKQENDLTI